MSKCDSIHMHIFVLDFEWSGREDLIGANACSTHAQTILGDTLRAANFDCPIINEYFSEVSRMRYNNWRTLKLAASKERPPVLQ